MEQTKPMKTADVERQLTEARIVEQYKEMVKADPDKAPTAIMAEIAYEEGYTLEGVRKLLIRTNIYVPKEQKEASDDGENDTGTNGQ